MKILIVEDDFTSRTLIQKILSHYGLCDITVNGREAVDAFKLAYKEGKPYDLICMDIMMPELDGQQALKEIRDFEAKRNIQGTKEVKVIMTTALDDPKNVVEAFYKGGATAYIVKPIMKQKLIEEVRKFGLIT